MQKAAGKIFIILFRIIGIIVMLQGIRMIGEGVYNYIDEHHQQDWITTTAYVVDISSEYSSSATRHSSDVDYDITYQYEVDGEAYSDILHNRDRALELGTGITIKYDPDSPKNSTDILKPSLYNLVIFLIFGTIMATIGFFLSGTWALICKIQRKCKPKREEVLPSKRYVKPKERKLDFKNSGKAMLLRLALAAVVLGVIMLSNKLFPGIQTVDAERFIEVVEAEGFTTTDTTHDLSQNWKVGSMMKRAVSLNDGNIRMDFCVMDTFDSATVLYDGMNLPLSEGKQEEHDGMVHELSSVENEELYVAKVRIRDTVIYVSAKAEYKAVAVDILKTLGYWKD